MTTTPRHEHRPPPGRFSTTALRHWALLVTGLAAAGSTACITADKQAQVATESSGIGWSCGSSAPSNTVTGGFATTYTSATTYSDCYKGKVVQINGYSSTYAVGGYTKVAWADAVPSDADCTESTVGAYLLRLNDETGEWEQVVSKGAHGDLPLDDIPSDIFGPPRQPVQKVKASALVQVPKDPSLFPPIRTLPPCRPPVVYFYGNEMQAEHTYKIVASARLPGAVLRQVSFTSVAGTCGQNTGDQCCTSGEPCAGFTRCDATTRTCQDCGMIGQGCCSSSIVPVCFDGEDFAVCGGSGLCEKNVCGQVGQKCCPNSGCPGNMCGADGMCHALCGDLDQSCCPTANGLGSCIQGTTCQVGMCRLPCGAKGQQCCGGGGCNSGLSCQGGNICAACGGEGQACCGGNLPCNAPMVCSGGVCGSRPPVDVPACNSTVEITLTNCFNVDGSPSTVVAPGSITVTTCGSDQASAEQKASLSLAASGFSCITSSPRAGCCTYSEQAFAGCGCP